MNVILTPLSPSAKDHLATTLQGNPICSLEQLRDGEIYVTSANRRYSTWIRAEGDPEWSFTFTRDPVVGTPGSQPY